MIDNKKLFSKLKSADITQTPSTFEITMICPKFLSKELSQLIIKIYF